MKNLSSSTHRELDIEALRRILEPIEEELEEAIKKAKRNLTEGEQEEIFLEIMANIIFDTLDQFPDFSDVIDSLEERLRRYGVSMLAESK